MYDVGKCLLPDILLQSHLTQQDLADKLGVTRQQINTYTSTVNRRVMTLSIAKNIAHVLNCSIDDLYEWVQVDERTKGR